MTLIALLITLVVVAVVLWVVWWVLGMIPIPANFRPIVNVVYALIALLVVVYYILLPLMHGVHA